ncbi:immunity 22 family protein [Xylocopilactobacillus apis]|uniref:Immunity protein 22 n=1 Tax=Xylocopilactobacillus apis TaxID=2932183 RepID=A0AAU9DGB9_9LACO|nr:immunity 22 family protein [Xylocopilactobacillus apis]BDR55767.1 hypothetical protein KIMC2_03290 [Xylocopilactobacillus apis]
MNEVNIQIWIGNNFAAEDKYLKYFEQNEDANPLDPNYVEECQFLANIGDIWFDPNFMVIPKRFAESQDIQTIIDIIKVDEAEKAKIHQVCEILEITEANAVFWYVNADLEVELEVEKPYRENYNGLKYIGNFCAGSIYEEKTLTHQATEQHVWLGSNFNKEYDEYFELDRPNNFCHDLGISWYDEDFIGYPKPLKKEVTVSKLVNKLLGPGMPCEQEIVESCHRLGIDNGNTLFWYDANQLGFNPPERDNYNGLKYIGKFSF